MFQWTIRHVNRTTYLCVAADIDIKDVRSVIAALAGRILRYFAYQIARVTRSELQLSFERLSVALTL